MYFFVTVLIGVLQGLCKGSERLLGSKVNAVLGLRVPNRYAPALPKPGGAHKCPCPPGLWALDKSMNFEFAATTTAECIPSGASRSARPARGFVAEARHAYGQTGFPQGCEE